MEYNEIQKKNHYFKVVLVRISTDEYIILKGPQEEKLLAEILQDDYNSTRYEKMLQLLADEVVQKDYRETFFKVFSMENMIKQFEEGKTMVEYSYIRDVGSEKKMVNTRVYPRLKQNNKLEELMIYVLS